MAIKLIACSALALSIALAASPAANAAESDAMMHKGMMKKHMKKDSMMHHGTMKKETAPQ